MFITFYSLVGLDILILMENHLGVKNITILVFPFNSLKVCPFYHIKSNLKISERLKTESLRIQKYCNSTTHFMYMVQRFKAVGFIKFAQLLKLAANIPTVLLNIKRLHKN